MRVQRIRYNSPATGFKAYIVEALVSDPELGKFILTFWREGGRWGSEFYVGKNYIVGSSRRSYSRNYTSWRGIPSKYRALAGRLRRLHVKKWGYRKRW